jgi:hypothetical protein
MLAGLFAEWRKFSPGLAGPEGLDERGLRLWWANEQLKNRKSRVESWKELTAGELRKLTRIIQEETGGIAAYRTSLIERIAQELWSPARAESELVSRAWERFQSTNWRQLSPEQAHELIEELLSRLARKQLADEGREVRWEVVENRIEELRERFSSRKSRVERGRGALRNVQEKGPRAA